MRMSLPSRAHGFALVLLAVLAGVLFELALPSGARAAEACPNEQLRQESNLNQQSGQRYSAELPDCRAYEQVSPVEKGQATVDHEILAAFKPYEQAAADGEGIMYSTTDALPGAPSGPFSSRSVAFRGPSAGWLTTSLGAPQLLLEAESSAVNIFEYFSPNLSCGVDETLEPMEKLSSNALAPLPTGETLGEVINLYLWNGTTGAYALVSNVNPANRLTIPGQLGVYHTYWANKECTRVVFATEYRLLAEAPATGYGLYEWHNGVLRLVSRRPDGTVTAVTKVGKVFQEEGSLVGAVSGDGSRIFYTGTSDAGADSGKKEVFLREGEGTAVEVSRSQTATPDGGATFEAAASDGSQVLFLANYGLTSPSNTGTGSDLYDYNVKEHTLTDLTVDTNASDTEGPKVNGLIGVSRDASYVYFSATGQLPASNSFSSQPQTENNARGEFNIYVWHNGVLGYVATITSSDETSGSQDLLGERASEHGARVTPDGTSFLFRSTKKLTSFNNTSIGGQSYPELYFYSVQSHDVVCVSCDPDGARPVGSASTSDPGFNHAYETRDVSDSGDQIFFTSEDPLAGEAGNGQNVFEWEREGAGSCTESDAHEATYYSGGCVYLLAAGNVFVDASSSGNDAFFLSRFPYVKQDIDGSIDLYDARVNGGFPAPPVATCSGEECQGELAEALSFSSPASIGAPVIGNASPPSEAKPGAKPVKSKALTNAQKLSSALKACKQQSRKKRPACESQAHKKYGPKAKSKPKAKAKGKSKKSSAKGAK